MTSDTGGYTVENAKAYGWGSISDNINPDRKAMLDRYVVGKRVLDAGCGGGGYVRYLSQCGYDAVGVDNQDQFLALAEQAPCGGEFVHADLTEGLPFDDKSFDTTICFDVLEHVDDERVIRELARVTRHRLIITVPHDAGWLVDYGLLFATYRDVTHLRYYTEESLRKLLNTIHVNSESIFGEQTRSLRTLVVDKLSPHSRYKLLDNLYCKLFRKLLYKSEDVLLHMNLAAIVDLYPKE